MKPKNAYKFSKKKGKIKELEEIILTDPYYSYCYARDVIKGRWEEGEEVILNSYCGYDIIIYARDVIKGRWEEGEEVLISKFSDHYDLFLYYARDVIKGKWEEGEHILMKRSSNAYLYTRDVIKRKWEEAEEYMNGDKEYVKDYVRRFYGEKETLSNIRMRRDLSKMINF